MSSTPDVLVIFGAGGDLTRRLLLPGLGQLVDSGGGAGLDVSRLRLLGVGMVELSDDEWRRRVAEAFESGGATSEAAERLAREARYLRADVTSPDDLTRVFEAAAGTPAIYFALPPAVTEASVAVMQSVSVPKGTVLALEKPFGTGLQSAAHLNDLVTAVVPERRVHRVDHFLGKSTVLNLLGLRFANRLFEHSWNRDAIESVDIVFDETLALEGRAGYYDSAGALVDMIQSHLLQVLALVAMEPPSSLTADDLRGGMAQVLRATRVGPGAPASASRRARYTAGRIGERELPAYVDEQGVDPSRQTETLAEMSVTVENWRWAGVPFRLRSGKAVGAERKEIIITFRDVPHLPDGLLGVSEPSRLRISLSPEDVRLDVLMNGGGDPFDLDCVTFEARLGTADLGPYGEVLSGILTSDPTLSLRGDVIEECWRIVEPVLTSWREGNVPMEEYPAGSMGPEGWSEPLA
ncbi:glucose-6-phosphate dehydrogenase [Salinibacterium sp. SYSU T00001]|uniref:glucose-6-phosphate dehydrogenase n=1 Tax=Homoserinimonas sedimenticola TaxID=2986805 RepID=UPI002236A9FE|nr:glucose-6-phosphate dehydrogenase [Salinibacterium sedimenticola]MCW4384616.1 glucose-6-phosphate dehydrogenase [Salinibacterium sedimenticola]